MNAIDELRRLREAVQERAVRHYNARDAHALGGPVARDQEVRGDALDDVVRDIDARIAELEVAPSDPLRELLVDVANSGVSYDEPRLRWVEVQIGRDTWDELQKLRAALGGTNG